MSSVFRGSRAFIESGFPDFIPERRAFICFLSSVVLLLFLVLTSHQMFPNFLLWLALGVFLWATIIRMRATCQQLQTEAQAHAAADNDLIEHTEQRLHVPPFATRGELHGLRLQLALLDRDFDDLDYEALSTLDSDIMQDAPPMSEEDINAFPVHKYKVQSRSGSASGLKSDGSSMQQASSSSVVGSVKMQDNTKVDRCMKFPENELTCSVCLEEVNVGELIRSLPCLHQFHVSCIDPWLRQQGTCPICKRRLG